ncbi:MAG: DUF2341 domain-containing protein [Myxococcota bacterium]
MRIWTSVAGLSVVAACGPQPDFRCQDAAACVLDGAQGRCEAVGYCSYADDGCASGRRFGRYAGSGLADLCVDVDAGTSSSTGAVVASEGGTSTGDPVASGSVSGTETGTSSETGDPIPADWWDAAWSSRVRLTVAGTGLRQDAVDFPLLIAPDVDRLDYGRIAADAADLRFVDPDTGEVLAHEVEAWNSDGRSTLWLRLPSLSASRPATVDLYYGNPRAEAPTRGPVWDEHYVGVWHFNEGFADASASGLDGMGDAAPTAGILGGAARFDEAMENDVAVPSAPAIVDVFAGGGTAEAWFRLPVPDNGPQLVNKSETALGRRGWTLKVFQDTRFEFRRDINGTIAQFASPDVLTADAWHHAAAVFDDDDPAAGARLYFDGAPVAVETIVEATGAAVSDAGLALHVGNDAMGDRALTGDVDEVRVSDVARDPGFIAAQFESMNDRLVEWAEPENL